MEKDYYKILGVEKTATDDELKKAYRSLSKKYHPDLQQGKSESEKKHAEEMFKDINEAYSVLGDKDKRHKYDTYGAADMSGAGFGPGGFDPMSFFRNHFSDAFGDFGFEFGFGGSRGGGFRRPRNSPDAPKDGRDIKISLDIPFEEALFGVTRSFDIKFDERCQSCNGTGSKNGEMDTCPECGGTGMVTIQLMSNFIQSSTCPRCHGTGSIPKSTCDVCHGMKTSKVEHHIHIHIPAGVDSGATLRVPGEGEHGTKGGRNGDLYISLSVGESELFKRSKLDLFTRVYVPAFDFFTKDSVSVATPWGKQDVKIPTSQGEDGSFMVKLSGYGVRRKSHTGGEVSGDLYVFIIPEIPGKLTEQQKKLAKKLSDSFSGKGAGKLSKRISDLSAEFEKTAAKLKT